MAGYLDPEAQYKRGIWANAILNASANTPAGSVNPNLPFEMREHAQRSNAGMRPWQIEAAQEKRAAELHPLEMQQARAQVGSTQRSGYSGPFNDYLALIQGKQLDPSQTTFPDYLKSLEPPAKPAAGVQEVDMLARMTEAAKGGDPAAQAYVDAFNKINPPDTKTAEETLDLTPGQKKVDQTFGTDYAAYVAGGGYAGVESNLGVIQGIHDEIRGAEEGTLSGPLIGNLPDAAQEFAYPQAADIRERLAGVVQQTLKQILGSQFTQKEAENLVKRAYNPALSQEINARRVATLLTTLRRAALAKDASAKYYEEHGSLKGFTGDQISATDLYNMDLDTPVGDGSSRSSPARPTTQAEYDALPPGAYFINPADNKLKQKPRGGGDGS